MGAAIPTFITEVVIPVAFVFYVLSRLGKSTWNEKVLYELIGLLTDKAILTAADLAKLHLFEPREDMIESFVRLIRG